MSCLLNYIVILENNEVIYMIQMPIAISTACINIQVVQLIE